MTNQRSSDGPTRGAGFWLAAIVAAIVAVFGAVLLAGGIWLIVLGGSWYYALAGAGLLATAGLLARRSPAGVGLYGAIWLATLGWAYWEVGLDRWAQLPRVAGPTVLLVILLLCLPALGRRHQHAMELSR